MELKLDIYETRLCRKVAKTCTANDFELSTAVCEDTLKMINIDMFSGGLQALSEESQIELISTLVNNGLPFFKDLIKEIFEITDEEVGKTKIADMVMLVKDIVKYSFLKLKGATGNNTKNE